MLYSTGDACTFDVPLNFTYIRRCGSQELKEMLPEGVLSIAIRADFWQPQKNERKAELVKYWHQHAVLDRMNI